MTISVSSVLARAGTLLLDEGFDRWTTDELLKWLNDGQRELVKVKADAKVRTVEHSLVAGAKQTNPDDCIEILGMPQNVGGGSITPCDRVALDRFSPDWMVKPTDNKVKHWMDDPHPNTFYVYPAQNGTPASVVLTYTAVPNQVAAMDNIDVRDIYADNLLNFILYRAFSKDAEFGGDAARAVAYYQAFSA